MDHTKVWSFFMNVDYHNSNGALAQLGERLVRNQKVTGSNPASSTIHSCNPGFLIAGSRVLFSHCRMIMIENQNI